MVEAVQFLQRICEHFGDKFVVTMGVHQHMISFSLGWEDETQSYDVYYDMTIESIKSSPMPEILEKMVILHFENQYKMWEVGEI